MSKRHQTVRSAPFFSPPNCRGAFLWLHKPKEKDGDGKPLERPIYMMTLVVPKLNADPQQCSNYQTFAAPAAQVTLQAFGGQFPQGMYWPIKDGDNATPDILKKYPWRQGHWLVEASNTFPVGVAIAQNGQAVPIPSQRIDNRELYKPGDYCIASLYAYSYHNKTFGVKFNLEAVVFTGEGERIGGGGGRSIEAVFGGMTIPGSMPAFPSHVPQAPQAPQSLPGGMPPQAPVPPQAPQSLPGGLPPQATPSLPNVASGGMPQGTAPFSSAPMAPNASAVTGPNGMQPPANGNASSLSSAATPFQPFPQR